MPVLEGLRVIDLTRVLAGPYCAMLLGDMGADVIKVEEPSAGDDTRGWGPFLHGWSTYFVGINRNKRSVAIDLKSPEGLQSLIVLLRDADVFIENIRPGKLTELGLGFDAVHALNRRLVYCSISGYGHTGPRRHVAGYDPVIQAESGFMDITGTPDGPPTRTGIAMTDYLAALYALSGILLALRDRDRTGTGQHVDIALYDAILSTLTMPIGLYQISGKAPSRLGNDHSSIAPYETLNARDGALMIAAGNPRLWQQLCAAIDAPELADDPRFRDNTLRVTHRPALKAALEARFAAFTVAGLAERLEQFGVPCGRVRSIPDAFADPQVEPRQMLLSFDDPELTGFRVPGNPIKLSASPAQVFRRPPRLGEHNDELLR